jgi:uncharacterized repeat protein (TIGR01451 family)
MMKTAGRRRGGATSSSRWIRVAAVLASALVICGAAAGAPFQLTDISPDASIIPQPRNGSQSGRVNGLDVAPGGNQVAYAATEWGGLYKTTDGALSWVHLDSHLPQATWDVAVDPSNPSTVYATSLYDGRADSLGGINVSYNGGATWVHPAVPDTSPTCPSNRWDEPSTFGIAVQPDAPNNVYVGTACGIAVSHDFGATWTHEDPDPADGFRRIWDVVAQPGGIVDICGTSGHHRSIDFGGSWTPANPPPSGLPTGGDTCSIAASPLENDVLFAVINSQKLWESDDGGATWTALDDGLGNRRPFVVTNQTGPNSFDVYLGSAPKLRQIGPCDDSSVPTRCPSANAADNMVTLGADITDNAHDDTGDLAFDPTGAVPQCPYLLSTDGGVYRSDDCGASWTRAMVGLHDTWLFDLAATVLPGNATGLYFGLMDDGFWYSQDGGASWGNPSCCDIFDVMADQDRVISTFCCQGGTPFTGLNQAPANDPSNISPMTPPPSGWLMWFQLQDSMAPFAPDSYVFVTETAGNAAFETANGNGPGGVWITQDVGTSYTQLGVATTPANACGVEVATSVGTPTFYVITDNNLNASPYGLCSGGGGRLWKYTGTNPNGAWTAADTGLTAVGVFGVDPNDPNRLYASDLTTTGPRIVFSSDGGASWNADPKLDVLMTRFGVFLYANSFGPEVRWFTPSLTGYSQPTMIAYHPTNPNVLLAGATDAGLFMSSNGGQAWTLLTDTLPRVWHPAFDPVDDSVFYVGTVGRGVWKVNLPDADLTIEKSDDPDPVAAGTTLTYTLTVTNEGPDDVPNVTVADTLPDGVEQVSNDAGCIESPVGLLTCELGNMANGDVRQVTIEVEVAADLVFEAGGPTTITNTASVTGVAVDPTPADNTVTEDTDVVAVADLEIVSFQAVNPPAELLVGQQADITLRKVITNHGPSAPMDVRLTTTAQASAGATVVPPNLVLEEQALALDELRQVDEIFTVSCQQASSHTFTFSNTITPAHAADTDPNPANNNAVVQLEILCVVPVAINIKPGSFPNSINPANSTVTVAVLTTTAGEYGLPLAFDATTIDPLSVRFGPADVVFDETGGAFERHNRGHIERSIELDEVTKDADLDMVLHFEANESGIGPGDTEACVKGEWIDGGGQAHKFFGCDSIRLVPPA